MLSVPSVRRPRRLVSPRTGKGLFLIAAVCSSLAILSHVSLTAREFAGGQEAQRPSASFRVGIDYVNVDVTVLDDKGRFVSDLRPEDFEVYEDGKRQQVSAFTLVQIPIERHVPAVSSNAASNGARPARIEADVRSNGPDTSGRVYVLVLDDLHVSPLRSTHVQAAARRFIEQRLGPNDMAAVLHTSGKSDASQEFTSDTSLLLRAVDQFVGRKLRSAVLEQLDVYQRRPDAPTEADLRMTRIADPLAGARADHARSMLATLTNVGDLLARSDAGRKAVVLFSEGLDYDLQMGAAQTQSGLNTFTNPDASVLLSELQQTIRASARANISIYGVDPRGLAGTGEELIEVTSLPQNPLLGLTTAAFDNEVRRAQDSLRVLSEETGGFTNVDSNDLDGAFDRIVADNSMYYLLGYRSDSAKQDGRFRKIEVRVARRDVRVRARSGYTASPPKKPERALLTDAIEPSEALRDALNNPLPVSALPLRLFAAPFKAETGASVLVGVEVDGRNFRFEEKDGLHLDTLEVAIVAVDDEARFKTGDRHRIDLRLKPATYTAVRANGLRLLFRLNLPPGRFQLRAAAHESGSEATGSVFYDLEVPDFAGAPLAMSGLILTTPRVGQTPTARPDAALQKALPSPPSATRRFRAGETMTTLFEVYGSASGGNEPLTIVTSVTDTNGQVRFRSEQQSAPGQRNFTGVMSVPLSGLPAGLYTLRIAANPRNAPDRAATRALPFEIRAGGNDASK